MSQSSLTRDLRHLGTFRNADSGREEPDPCLQEFSSDPEASWMRGTVYLVHNSNSARGFDPNYVLREDFLQDFFFLIVQDPIWDHRLALPFKSLRAGFQGLCSGGRGGREVWGGECLGVLPWRQLLVPRSAAVGLLELALP